MNQWIWRMILLLFNVLLCSHGNEQQLLTFLAIVNPKVRTYTLPRRNVDGVVDVNVGLSLREFHEINEETHQVAVLIWLDQRWSDYALTWAPEEYDGVSETRMRADEIWTPDTVLLNGVGPRGLKRSDTVAYVSNDGQIMWVERATLRAICDFQVDIVQCSFKLGTLTYTDRQLNLQSQYYRGWDVSGFTDFHDYSLTAYNVTTPTCCPRELPLHLDFTLTLTKPTTGWWTP